MPRDKTGAGVAGRFSVELSPDMLANIHGRLSCLDRIAFASVFRKSRDAFKPEAPWLVLPGDTLESATVLSLADRCVPAERSPSPAMRGHGLIGSSRGWLVTADERGRMSLANPVTGEQRALPAITTIPCIEEWTGPSLFIFDLKPFVRGPPYARGEPYPHEKYMLRFDQMRNDLYRKVVLSDGGHGAAMLITGWLFGVAAFTTMEDATWRLAPSRDGVEDAIHHDGRFYSVTYSGAVEVWEHDAYGGVFTSATVTPGPANAGWTHPGLCRRYLVAAPGGRFMVVLKTDRYNRSRRTSSFKVHVLDGAQWKETDDIGDTALFVGANESLCMSTMVHPELKAGCVYFTEDRLGQASLWKDAPSYGDDGQRGLGVFCLKDGTMEKVEGQGWHRSWPPPAWFTPSIP
ncbi:hypothetical protein QYE76_071502 [Lolium multiflorum]|uniref:KIB1-4 beta-propeller domain-containing protein n=1 Tax=Lolium multiflorum TaxID=4521 RepID=A0AAD8SM83_LOLMU|nr:hypothetical protein QYE76_071502 [Lolium multiflorum]